jgi:hypothetical protein
MMLYFAYALSTYHCETKDVGRNCCGLEAPLTRRILGKQMKRNLLIANTVLLAAFFLIILGMRNTSLDHTSGPKPRPRAVVEKASKAPIAACCELQHLDAEADPAIAIVTISEAEIFFTQVISHTPALTQHFLPSRASPVLLSRLS